MRMRTIAFCLVFAAAVASSEDAPPVIPKPYRANFNIALGNLLASLREPASLTLTHVEVMEKTGSICMIYRARNGFGGMGMEHFAYVLPPKALLTESDSAFKWTWSEHCGLKKTIDITAAARVLLAGVSR